MRSEVLSADKSGERCGNCKYYRSTSTYISFDYAGWCRHPSRLHPPYRHSSDKACFDYEVVPKP